MTKNLILSAFILFIFSTLKAQINPIESPYYQQGNYTVVSDSDMTAISVPLLFYYPQTTGNYPVFMFQLGANGLGSSVINRHTYDLFMKHLASYGVVVIVIDDSQAGFPNGTTFKAAHTWYKSKCIDNNHWLSTYADVDKFIVGGHSNGGVNASALLVDRPTEVNGIVFFDSYPSPGTFGFGAHDVSNYTGKELTMAANENVPDTYKGGYTQFTSSTCKTYVNIEGLDHGGFGDYVLASQPVGPIGRENATASIRHFFVSWILSEFTNNSNATIQLATTSLHPTTTKEFLNDCGTVGTREPEKKSIVIYPNPVNDFLYIENCLANSDIKIYNTTGQIVYEVDNKQGNISIDLSSYSKGMYLLKITDANNGIRLTERLIKR
ncbi:MAG: T9SS type A sorting domain-containing protein [Bacteroidota bacterium]